MFRSGAGVWQGEAREWRELEVEEGVKLEADCALECGEGELVRKVSAVLHEMLGMAADCAEKPT